MVRRQTAAAAAAPGENGSDASPWRARFDAIHHRLRQRIVLLHYPPGARLDVDALAREFGVSRTPVRSVLQQLEREGLAITRHGVGTAVTGIDFGQLREATLLRMHLCEVVGVLGPRAPDAAVLSTLERLEEDCGRLSSRLDCAGFAHIDMRLHDCKCGLIGNRPLRRIYDELYYRTARMWFFFLPRLDWREEVAALGEDIRLVRGALARGDVAAMGYLTRNAISNELFRVGDLFARGAAAGGAHGPGPEDGPGDGAGP
jgi:DNA-binding GntR family transcriptional regulator